MPKILRYGEFISRLRDFGVIELPGRGKGSERYLIRPSITGTTKGPSYTIRCHGSGDTVKIGTMSACQGGCKSTPRNFGNDARRGCSRFIPVGNGLNRRTLVYDKDVGRAAALAVSHLAAAGRVFNVTDGGFHTLNEIIESICSALGRKPPRLSLPVGPTRTLIGLIEKGSHAMGIKPPVTKAIIDKYTEDIAVDGSLIQKELGFVPQYDLKAGWVEMVKERDSYKL